MELAFFSFMLFFSASAQAGPIYSETISTAREILWNAVTSGGINCAAVAVMDSGQIVYSEGFGAADRSTNRPADGKTRFNIGSTSKMFAAAAILILADENKLTLDDPVVKHLPEFVMNDPRHRDITIRMLFNHSSGLPGSTFTFSYRADDNPHLILLETLKECSLKHDPGAMSIYCNDGFTLAEMIVERVSGMDFIKFLSAKVFLPLGMNSTGASLGASGGSCAEYYDNDGKKYPMEAITVLGAGGLSSTVEDLCRFSEAFMPGGKSIFSPSSLKEILSPQATPFSKDLKGQALLDAFGWDYALLPDFQALGHQMVGKSGGSVFYSTNLQILPSKGLSVAVIFSGHGAAERATYKIMEALMKEKGLSVPAYSPLSVPVVPEPIPEELLVHAGYYVDSEKAALFEFDRDKGFLTVRFLQQPEAAPSSSSLVLVYNGGFFHDLDEERKYYFIGSGEKTFLVLSKIPRYGADIPFFQKITVTESPQSLLTNMKDTVWLLRNGSPFLQSADSLLVRSSTIPELPGYVNFWGLKKVESPEYASIAATGFRDQSSLKLFSKGEEIRAKVIHLIFSRADDSRPVSEGKVSIGDEGENEWRKMTRGAILSCVKPKDGRFILFSGKSDPSLLYDSISNVGDVYAPEGSYLFFAGNPGDVFEVSLR
jgi:CubicO group peptidase (beta-lactamase class C family)